MRYSPEMIVTHGYKLLITFTSNIIFVMRKNSKMDNFLNINKETLSLLFIIV